MTETRWGAVLFIQGENNGKYPYSHSLYLEADTRVILDPASDRARLAALIQEPGVDVVWLSHSHEDHLTHLDLFTDQELWIAEADAPPLGNLETFIDYYGVTEPEYREYWRKVMIDDFNYRPRQPDRLFKAPEVIDLGGLTVEVIPAPGHTPGHLAFFFREPQVLFMGDYDLTKFGPWYGDFYSDVDQTVESIKRLRDIPAKVWIASHEQGVFESEPGDLWDRYLGVIEEREAKLLDVLKTPKTMEEIIEARILYRKKREPKAFYDFGEQVHMDKHLKRLIRQGVVLQEGEVYRLV